jgi:hypothetical protein
MGIFPTTTVRNPEIYKNHLVNAENSRPVNTWLYMMLAEIKSEPGGVITIE